MCVFPAVLKLLLHQQITVPGSIVAVQDVYGPFVLLQGGGGGNSFDFLSCNDRFRKIHLG
jgi:hypothetical protein